MRDWIRRALTRTVTLQTRGKRAKQAEKVQLPPPEALVWGVLLAIIFFCGFCALQIIHMLKFGAWNSEVWAGMMLIVGIILGAFFGGRA